MAGKARPITPAQASKKAAVNFPNEIINAVNNLISEKFSGRESVSIKQKDIISEARRLGLEIPDRELFDKGYLNLEPVYRKAGWTVGYEKPSYGDSDFDAYFTFKIKK